MQQLQLWEDKESLRKEVFQTFTPCLPGQGENQATGVSQVIFTWDAPVGGWQTATREEEDHLPSGQEGGLQSWVLRLESQPAAALSTTKKEITMLKL